MNSKPIVILHKGRKVKVPDQARSGRIRNAEVIDDEAGGLIKVKCGRLTPWWVRVDEIRFADPPLHRPVLFLLLFLLPLCGWGQTVTTPTNGLAWCFAHPSPVTMITNKVMRDIGTVQSGGLLRTQILDLKCPICKVRQTITNSIWTADIPKTNRFADRMMRIRIPKRVIPPVQNK